MRAAIVILALTFLLLSQGGPTEDDTPAVTTFVAPPYPQAARNARTEAKTLTRIAVNRDGVVTKAETISAHPVFQTEVWVALKQWRFKPSRREHTLQVTCIFEFTDYERCNGAARPPTLETHISAELPAVVHIKTDVPCSVVDQATALR